jgi:hypothetical protein
MRSSVINKAKLIIPIPTSPIIMDPDALTPEEEVSRMTFRQELESHIKRKSMLDDHPESLFTGRRTVHQLA